MLRNLHCGHVIRLGPKLLHVVTNTNGKLAMMVFILHVATTRTMPLPLCMMSKPTQLHGLPIAPRKGKELTGKVHLLVQREICF